MTVIKTQIAIEDIRESLSASRVPEDPTQAVMPPEAKDWPARFLDMASGNLKAAGVLIPIIDRPGGLTVLLTQRSSALRVHAGQVSFPGGRMESSDQDIVATALNAHGHYGSCADYLLDTASSFEHHDISDRRMQRLATLMMAQRDDR